METDVLDEVLLVEVVVAGVPEGVKVKFTKPVEI